MNGAKPAMPKEQALAWCEDKVDSGADLKIEQARLNGALSDAMQPKTYTMNGFTNCNSIGSYTNCNTTGYATPMPSYNSGQYGQAMGAALGAAFARPGEIKKCMAMLGYSEIEVQQNQSRPTTSSVQSSSQAATQMRALNPLGAGSEASDVFNGWSIAKLDKVQGFTGCFAMNINSAEQGLPLSIMIEKGRYDKAILSVRHDGKASPTSDVGTVRLAALELKNLPMRSLTGSEALTPLDLTPEVRNALETRGLLSWDVNHQYAFVLPEAPNLIQRLIQCADAPTFSSYRSMILTNSNQSSSPSMAIDFAGGNDGLTNEQRYKLARQILEFKEQNKSNNSSAVKPQIDNRPNDPLPANASITKKLDHFNSGTTDWIVRRQFGDGLKGCFASYNTNFRYSHSITLRNADSDEHNILFKSPNSNKTPIHFTNASLFSVSEGLGSNFSGTINDRGANVELDTASLLVLLDLIEHGESLYLEVEPNVRFKISGKPSLGLTSILWQCARPDDQLPSLQSVKDYLYKQHRS